MTTAPRHVALLRLSALGDVCQAIPALHALQTAWPHTRFTWIAGRIEAGLLQCVPGVTVATYDKRTGLSGMGRLRRALPRFDLLLHLQTSARSNLLSLISVRAREKVGLGRPAAREGHALVVDRQAPLPPRAHAVDTYLAVVRALGIEPGPARWDLEIPETARAWAATQLPDGPWLAVNPSASPSRRVHREWPLERMAQVMDWAAGAGLRVVLVGGPGARERQRAERLRDLCRSPFLDLTGRTDLPQMLAVLQRTRLLLSVDSGPVHMATTVGTPVVGLYAATDPRQTGPYRDLDRVVSAYPEAVAAEYGRPPEALPWGIRCHDPGAMARIPVAAVTARLQAVLD